MTETIQTRMKGCSGRDISTYIILEMVEEGREGTI